MYEITYEDGTVEYTDIDYYVDLDRTRKGYHIVKLDGMLERYCVTLDDVWWYYVPWSDILVPFVNNRAKRQKLIERIKGRFRRDS